MEEHFLFRRWTELLFLNTRPIKIPFHWFSWRLLASAPLPSWSTQTKAFLYRQSSRFFSHLSFRTSFLLSSFMNTSDIEQLKTRLDQGSVKILRERYPWIPLVKSRVKDHSGLVSFTREEIELQLITDSSAKVFIVHTCIAATKAELDWTRRCMNLYNSSSASSSPTSTRGLLFALCVGTRVCSTMLFLFNPMLTDIKT